MMGIGNGDANLDGYFRLFFIIILMGNLDLD
jgi:hypothetical protein